MPEEIMGNRLTSEKIQVLGNLDEVAIKFSPFEGFTEFSKKIESELRRRYGTDGLEPDLEGNKTRYEGEKRRCWSHDCGSTYCNGLGDTYYVSGEELQEIAGN
ncbi:MAG: hypothetical protein GTN40_05335 [Candidatus Aenigmarchaeota archaeon]|nr:hypothetical protein [Candidatus Aenigmarchaeota archaeon]